MKKKQILFLLLLVFLIAGNLFAVAAESNITQKEADGQSSALKEIFIEKKKSVSETPVQKESTTDKIQNGNHANAMPDEDVLPKLRELSSNAGKPIESTIPYIKRLSQEFPIFKEDVISLASNPDEPSALRLQLLEVLKQQIDDKDAKNSLLNIFKKENPSTMPAAYAAKYLSEQGVDIGDKIIEDYANTDTSVRPIYLRALGRLKRSDAISIIRDAFGSDDFHSRLAAIEAIGYFPDTDSHNSNLLLDIIGNKGRLQDGLRPPIKLEIEAGRAVSALGAMGDKSVDSLLEIASDNELAINVRISAVEALPRHILNKDNTVAQQLHRIEQEFALSGASQADKIRFKQMVSIVTNTENDM